MKLERLILFLLLSASITMYGQSHVTVSGVVIDEKTSEPLIFASVGISGISIGTISNTIGEFDFHIPMEQISEFLEIQMLGYETFVMNIEDVLSQNISEFRLTRTSKFLDEVVIADSLSGGDIYTIAINRVDLNFPGKSFLMDGFYRDLKSVGGRYVALLESAVKIYDKDYVAPKNKYRLRERVALIEVRKSLGYDNKFTSFFDQTNLLEDLLLHNNVRYRQFPENKEFLNQLLREKSDFYNGKKVFVITRNGGTNLKMYIDALTFSFVRIEYLLGKQEEVIDKKQNLYSQMGSLKKIIEFKEFSGRMYLSHIDLKSDINWYDDETEELEFTTSLHQQLLINKVYPNTSRKIGTTEKMKRFGLQYQHKKYNKEFWDKYNVIKDTPLDKKIVIDLEQKLSLEKQFQGN